MPAPGRDRWEELSPHLDRALELAPGDRTAWLAELRAQIGEKASPTPAFDPAAAGGSSTTHYSVVDAEGNAVSCTTTLNDSYGSAVTVTGVIVPLNRNARTETVPAVVAMVNEPVI